MTRGEIYNADLDPVIGSEQGGKRPIVVLQNNVGNKYSPTVIVAAITSKVKKTNADPRSVDKRLSDRWVHCVVGTAPHNR